MQWLKNCGKVSGALMRESGAQTACRWGWDADFCIRSALSGMGHLVLIRSHFSAVIRSCRMMGVCNHRAAAFFLNKGLGLSQQAILHLGIGGSLKQKFASEASLAVLAQGPYPCQGFLFLPVKFSIFKCENIHKSPVLRQ